jgi:hypothetical protein
MNARTKATCLLLILSGTSGCSTAIHHRSAMQSAALQQESAAPIGSVTAYPSGSEQPVYLTKPARIQRAHASRYACLMEAVLVCQCGGRLHSECECQCAGR